MASDTVAVDVEPTVAVPAWAWELIAPVVREALALWFDGDGDPINFMPTDTFRYDVPVPVGDDPLPLDAARQFFAQRRGDQFLPLYRAVWELSSEDLAALLEMDEPAPDAEGGG